MASCDAPLMILVAGPYRSGTGDDPTRIARNMRAMNEAALALLKAQGDLLAGRRPRARRR